MYVNGVLIGVFCTLFIEMTIILLIGVSMKMKNSRNHRNIVNKSMRNDLTRK